MNKSRFTNEHIAFALRQAQSEVGLWFGVKFNRLCFTRFGSTAFDCQIGSVDRTKSNFELIFCDTL
jgi:hypothetical protein